MNAAKRKIDEIWLWTTAKIRFANKQRLRFLAAFKIAIEAANNFLSTRKNDEYFEPLTPVLLEGKTYLRYEKELAHALDDSDVLNIAITGKYGAGKSSLLKTFVQRNKQYKYAWVSLATFASKEDIDRQLREEAKRERDGQNVPSTLDRIEETIVQQLLYSVPTRWLPKTRLKRIYQAKTWVVAMFTIAVLLWCVSAIRMYPIYMAWPDDFKPPQSFDSFAFIPEWLAEIFLGFGLIYILYKCVQLALSIKIDSLTVKGGKIEVTNPGSVLHKNIDEIIYCFERSDIDVVLIEDLDRYEIQDVFFRLREINFIIKHSPQVSRPIHFVYALRDDFFEVSEKTKFFDVIIPLIPVVNVDNSKEQMRKLLSIRTNRETTLLSDLSSRLVDNISDYIDDMRVIKNVVNEYDINTHILAADMDLNRNKLFAIIVMRNLYPIAYAELLQKKGAIYAVFDMFERWQQRQMEGISQKLLDEKTTIEAQSATMTSSLQDLRALVWFRIIQLCDGGGATYVSEKNSREWLSISEFVNEEVFDKVTLPGKELGAFYPTNYSNPQQVGSWIKTETVLSNLGGKSYKEWVKILKVSLEERKQHVRILESDLQKLKNFSFREAGDKEEFMSEVGTYLTSNELGAITYLIRNHYFENDYVDYIGYFYHGSVSLNDKKFTLALREGKLSDANTIIDHPEVVFKQVNLLEISNGRGLVVGLIEHLCTTNTEENDLYARAIFSDAHKHFERLNTIAAILWHKEFFGKFLDFLLIYNRWCLTEFLKNSTFFDGPDKKEAYVVKMMETFSYEDFELFDEEELEELFGAIANLENVGVLTSNMKKQTGSWRKMVEYPVQFARVTEPISREELNDLIELGCIALNLDMMRLLLSKLSTRSEPFDEVSFHALIELGSHKVIRLACSQIDLVGSELTRQNVRLKESSESLKQLFSAAVEGQEDHLIEVFIDKTDTILDDIEEVPTQIWAGLFRLNRVRPSADAVYQYFSGYGLDQDKDVEDNVITAFTQYLQTNASVLKEVLWANNADQSALIEFILMREDIDDGSVSELLEHASISALETIPDGMSGERWRMLVQLPGLIYTSDIHEYIVETASLVLAEYLYRRWDAAEAYADAWNLDSEVLIEITCDGGLTLAQKLALWKPVSVSVIEDNKEAKELILMLCREANQTRAVEQALPVGLLESVLNDDELPEELRIEGILQLLPSMSRSDFCQAMATLHDPEWNNFPEGKGRLKVSLNETNSRLMTAFQDRGFISTVTEADGKLFGYASMRQ